MGRRIALALVLVVGLGIAFSVLSRREEHRAREEDRKAMLLRFDDRAVTAVVLAVGGVDWRFVPEAGGWRVAAPLNDAAGAKALTALLRACRLTAVNRVIEEPEALSAYGLDPPVAKLRLEGVHVPTLELGEVDPTGEGLFARVEGRPGILVLELPTGLPLLRPEPSALRDRALLSVSPSEVRGLVVRAGGGETRAEREPTGWWITAPRRLPASDAQVDHLLRGLAEAEVRAFEDGARPQDPGLGLGADAVEIRVATESGERILRLGATTRKGLRYATRDDRATVLALEPASLASLPLDRDALLEKRLTKVNRYLVAAFDYRAGAERFSAKREGKGPWLTDTGEALQDGSVYGFLARALEAPTTGWAEGAPTGDPAAVLEFELEGGAKDRVEFYHGMRARTASLPGLLYQLASPPPDVPVAN